MDIIKLPETVCQQCRVREATLLCDFIVGKAIDLKGAGRVSQVTCDKMLCEKCARKVNTKDYCKRHFEELKREINNVKNKR